MRAADQAHTSSAVSPEQAKGLFGRLLLAVIATLALLVVWRPALLHAQEPTTQPPAQEAAATANTKVHVVKAGETLWSLAARYYGDGHQWQNLARRNKIPTSGAPALSVGMRLTVPSKPTVRGANAAEVAAAPADSTVPRVALAKAGEGTLPTPPAAEKPAASKAPAGSLASQTSGKGNAAATARNTTARGVAKPSAPAAAPATVQASAASQPAKDTSRVNLQPQQGTMIGDMSVRRIGLVDSDAQADSRKASEIVTVFHRDMPDAAEAERRTRAVLRPNTPAPRQAEYDAAPFLVAASQLERGGVIASRVGSPGSSSADAPQRAIKTDQVELKAPAGLSLKAGDRLVSVTTAEEIAKGQRLVLPTGILEVVKAEAGKPVLAVVRRQTGRIEQGQRLLPAAGQAGEWVKAQKLDAPDVATTVKWLDTHESLPTLQSYLLLGAGSAQGLKAGDEVALYQRTPGTTADRLTATVRVVRVDRDFASAVITKQYGTDIAVGMVARRFAKAP